MLLLGITVIASFSCEDEKANPSDYTLMEIKKIDDFGCNDCIIDLHYEYMVRDTSYLIYSENDFNKFVKYRIVENPPLVDYEKYFLIIGIKKFEHGAELIAEKAKENSFDIVYTVTIQKLGYDVPTAVIYYAFLEKPKVEKNVRIEVVIK